MSASYAEKAIQHAIDHINDPRPYQWIILSRDAWLRIERDGPPDMREMARDVLDASSLDPESKALRAWEGE